MAGVATMLKVVFVDLRVGNLLIALAVFLIGYFLPDLAGSLTFEAIVPLKVTVDSSLNLTFTNPRFSYPLEEEQVGRGLLVILSAVIPTLLITASTLISFFCLPWTHRPQKNDGDEENPTEKNDGDEENPTETPTETRPVCTTSPAFYIGTLFMDAFSGLLETAAFTLLVTGYLKLSCGRPRPNYAEYYLKSPHDAVSSFPSGHTSISFCGLTYASAVLWHDIGAPLVKLPRMHILTFPLLLLFMSPLLLAMWIAVTRVQDYYHNYDDITAGAFIGMASSLMVFAVHNSVPKERYLAPKVGSEAKEMDSV